MDAQKRARLEAKGFRVGTVAEFLGLTDAESELVELRLMIASALRERRNACGLSQTGLAERLESSQSRVSRIETADPSVSLDLMLRAWYEIGATRADLASLLAAPAAGSGLATGHSG